MRDYARLVDGKEITIAYDDNKQIVCWGFNKKNVVLYLSKTGLYDKCELMQSDDLKFIFAVQCDFARYEVIDIRDKDDNLVVLLRKEYNYVMELNYETKSKVFDTINTCRELLNTIDFTDEEFKKMKKFAIMLTNKSMGTLSLVPNSVLSDMKSLRRAVEMEDELYNINDRGTLNTLCNRFCIILI